MASNSRQHYHFDSTCIIHYIDQEGSVFKVSRDVVEAVRNVVNRVKSNKNVALVFSNLALGEILLRYVKIGCEMDIPTSTDELSVKYHSVIDNLVKLKRDLGDRLILGYMLELDEMEKFVREIKEIDDRITTIDSLILSHAAADINATKFYTTDKNMILSARTLEKKINKLRRDEFGKEVSRLDITSPNY